MKVTEVKVSPTHGRGVFATRDIKKGTVFLVDPVIILEEPKQNTDQLKKYYYPWLGAKVSCVCMGHGSFFNHSDKPNVAIYSIDREEKTKSFITLRDVRKGEELFLKYSSTFFNKKQ